MACGGKNVQLIYTADQLKLNNTKIPHQLTKVLYQQVFQATHDTVTI